MSSFQERSSYDTCIDAEWRGMPAEAERANVRRLFDVWRLVEEEVGVVEDVGVRRLAGPVLAVDVRHHLRVVVVEARNDDLVEVDDDRVPVAVDVAQHTVVERRRTRQLHRRNSRLLHSLNENTVNTGILPIEKNWKKKRISLKSKFLNCNSSLYCFNIQNYANIVSNQ